MRSFENREMAGRLLAARLALRAPLRPVVYALPRGGVPIAIEIAKRLNAPLDLLLVRKIGVPSQPELAAGAVVDGERPDIILNKDICRAAGLPESEVASLGAAELKEIERRRALYLPGKDPVPARGRTAILVDDGVATGASMEAAIAAVRRRAPDRIIVAAPSQHAVPLTFCSGSSMKFCSLTFLKAFAPSANSIGISISWTMRKSSLCWRIMRLMRVTPRRAGSVRRAINRPCLTGRSLSSQTRCRTCLASTRQYSCCNASNDNCRKASGRVPAADARRHVRTDRIWP